jgi:uncharacterized protein CbrC (UPF0167 family)
MANSKYTKGFREWLQEMWMSHKDELDGLGQHIDYDIADYFNRYKYWLKREYKHQMRTSNV